MALLATLEGETMDKGISLNDLFDVNDFLGIKYFGPYDWDRIKKYACQITRTAANRPTVFFIENLSKNYPKNTGYGSALMGYNDTLGVACMGAPAWETVKNKIDCELLGAWWNPVDTIKDAANYVGEKAGEVLRPAVNATKKILDAPQKFYKKAINALPFSEYNPVTQLYNKYTDIKEKFVDNPTKEALQQTVDTSSGVIYKIATESPLKYLPTAQIIAATEKARETANITSPGTAGVYKTAAQVEEEEQRKKEAAARHAALASQQATQYENEQRAKILAQNAAAKAQAEAVTAQEEAAVIQQNLEQTQATLSNKYAPWILGGAGLLLALSILKK